ncbi:hypothetical protein [Pendulispora albinea]|uniref:Uncharacterized protein n=1 Tax=Pendulispora albinea TaxID=2741071 RepID=A0ABZ2LXI4_9BACT
MIVIVIVGAIAGDVRRHVVRLRAPIANDIGRVLYPSTPRSDGLGFAMAAREVKAVFCGQSRKGKSFESFFELFEDSLFEFTSNMCSSPPKHEGSMP